MTKEEVNELLGLLKANYGYAFKELSAGQKRLLVESWAICLADVDAKLGLAAVMRLIATSKWMPSVAEVRKAALELYEGAMYELQGIDGIRQSFPELRNRAAEAKIPALRDVVERGRNLSGQELPLDLFLESGVFLGSESLLQIESGETKEENK